MLKNMTQRERKKVVRFSLEFTDGEGCGYCFPCNQRGEVNPDEMTECAKTNLDYCMSHPEEFKVWNTVQREAYSYTEPARGTCTCGREVTLVDEYCGACACECGRCYNLFGQELLPPEQWEDDPSESDAWEGYEPMW